MATGCIGALQAFDVPLRNSLYQDITHASTIAAPIMDNSSNTESSGAMSRMKFIVLSRYQAAHALNELPHPQVVFACGFLIANPEPCSEST